ncbi:C40 family peptidase [Leptospira borgpetersenii]|uniref:C40 family peptidase n=1 Tax=Leptospira borgpetersenii TaxID=174 RepID=UPI000774CD86|nr:C40 family peptidase [Leptospira borgpetersenii]MBE8364787.1 C40 family peptidase [Leptospira borgpetersenii serovar Balcanica]MBE8366688.1 C40 family peptidase [Leptospira borgpetersenii serovar Balcanica]MBE8399547.1 C40 family peptidase [Leptospira borgpetersenii serovar Tarassovi]MBE8402613.1 C40 family peptidase [Leptospira borgpetersenii serovar Tarassovi]MBE8405733.1 C40 family peptidase [Leptospira borgpetersenii serovar Tarassovi]
MFRILVIFWALVWFSVSVFADPFSDLLKEDFEAGQTLLIRNSVFQKLGGKSKDSKVIEITKNTIPWAIMEGLPPDMIADLIVNQYYVSLSGMRFTEAEDAIPILSKQKLSDKDFVLISLFVKETNKAGIREEIRNVFLSTALKSRWDGFSILAGGRALIAGKYVGIPENRLASRVLGLFPSKGATSLFEKTDSAFRQAIFFNPTNDRYTLASDLLSQLKSLHDGTKSKSLNSWTVAISAARTLDRSLDSAGEVVIGDRPKFGFEENIPEPPLVPELEPDAPIQPGKMEWEILNSSNLLSVVKEWLGTPYYWGGTSKKGVDCSGFTFSSLTDKRIGVPVKIVPRLGREQAKLGSGVSHSSLRAGDLIFFSASPNQSKITHVGLVISEKEFAHASSTRGVVIDKISMKWWLDRYVTSRRLFQKIQ